MQAPSLSLPVAFALLTFTIAASARDIRVPADHRTIQAAIDASEDGDRVLVSPGVYDETIDFSGKNIVVKGNPANPWETVIDAGGNGSAVTIADGENDAVFTGFAVTNGSGTEDPDNPWNYTFGGGLYISGADPTISFCVIRGNHAEWGGGGAEMRRANPTFNYCEFSGNRAWDGAGGGARVVRDQPDSLHRTGQ